MNTMQCYSINQVYKQFVGVIPRMYWKGFVWNIISVPKHGFICWLVMDERLHIYNTERMFKIEITADPCVRFVVPVRKLILTYFLLVSLVIMLLI